MEFRKKIEILQSELRINHQTKILLLGSCFAENIGQQLLENKFSVNVNPFGVLYNPASILQAIKLLQTDRTFTKDDVFENQGVFRTYFHHSAFSSSDGEAFLKTINQHREKASIHLKGADLLLITFGTAYVYNLKETGQVVANCHKQPSNIFDRNKLSVKQIVSSWTEFIEESLNINSNLKILFTVSPIRHWKDGAHNNQLSKATLLLAIDELMNKFSNLYYFPSYEIVLDELRDYRFYAEDMIHPSDVAIRYIWEIFNDTYFDEETKKLCRQWLNISRAIAHRPFNEGTQEHKQFLKQTLLKLQSIRNNYPYFDCEKELIFLENKLSSIKKE